MVDARHMPDRLAVGDQQALSTPDVVENFAAIDLPANSCHRECHGILNNHECSRQLLNTIPALSYVDENSLPLLQSSRANFGLDVLIDRNVRFLVLVD